MQIAWGSDSGRGKAIRTILDEFQKENPNIKVKMVGSAQNGQKLLTQILSGKAPDVMQLAYRQVQSLAAKGAYVDLTSQLGNQKDNYYQQLWKLGEYNGKLYGFPWMGHSIQLVYNKTLFDKAGIKSPPTTWDELYRDAKLLTHPDKNQYGIGLVGKQSHDIAWLFNMFLHQAGGKLVKSDGNGGYKVAIDSPEGKKALNFYTKLVKEVSPPDTATKDGGGVMADFRNQVVAMEFQGPWGITDIWQNGRKFDVASAQVPAGPAGRAADIGPYMLSIPQGVKGAKLDASIKLIKFLGTKKGQAMLMKGEKGKDGNYYPFRVPIRKDMQDMPYFKQHPEFLPFIQGFQYPSISTPIPQWAQVENEVYQSTLNQVVNGHMSVDKGLQQITQKGNEIIKNK